MCKLEKERRPRGGLEVLFVSLFCTKEGRTLVIEEERIFALQSEGVK